MEPNKKKIVDLGILESDEVSGVKKISLVEEPAIMLDFQYFNTVDLAEVGPRGGIKESPKAPKGDTPNKDPKGEGSAKGNASNTRSAKVSAEDEKSLQKKADEFNERYKEKLGYGVTVGMLKTVYQRGLGAFNSSHSPEVNNAKQWAMARVNSFLYIVKNDRPENPKYTQDNDLLPSKHPKAFAIVGNDVVCDECGWTWAIADGGEDVYICHKCGCDNTPDIEKFESYTDYPEQATENAKIALRYADKNGWGSCGTPVGKARANQLANGEAISEETIARMASFERQRQNSDKELGDGCGRLMWLAWGGDAGVEWAQRKLKEIREDFEIDVTGLPAYVDQVPKKKKDIVTRAILAQSECDNSWTEDQYVVDTIIAVAKEIGTKEKDLNKLFEQEFAQAITPGTNPSEASQTKDRELILYKYMGRIGADSRSFCRQMVSADLYYTKQQIESFDSLIANPGFGHNGNSYSLFKYKGGPNCKHNWNDFAVKSSKDGKITINDLGAAAGTAGIKPKNMPKNGYYSKNSSVFSFAAEEQQILVGPAMVPDMKIVRVDENGQRYFVKFSPETIKEIALKYFKEGRVHELNTDHEENTAGAYIFESWITETDDDKANTLYGYNVPKGTWMISVKVEDPKTWRRVKAGELRGFSIEGILVDMEELEAFKTYEKIKKILGTNI